MERLRKNISQERLAELTNISRNSVSLIETGKINPTVLKVIDIAKASYRWRLVGNAVTVDTVKWIAIKIKKPQKYDATNDVPFNFQSNWPKSAWNMGEGVYISKSSLYPQNTEKRLMDYITHEKHPLSLKATSGFLKRLENGKMKPPYYFANAIVNYMDKLIK